MKKPTDIRTRERIVQLLFTLAEHPRTFTLRQLAERYDVSQDTIKGDFEALRNVGLTVDYADGYRYYVLGNKTFERFKDLLYFSAEDQAELYKAIDQMPVNQKRRDALKAKLGALYDYRRLGHAFLRTPHLTKIDHLETAKAGKKRVILEKYRSSNSNSVKDRLVEPFLISAAEDTVQTFDVEKGEVAHFRISRAEKIQLTDQPWQHEDQHYSRLIDPFRIVDNEQVMVHLRLRLGACNELIERFPTAKSHVEPAHEPEMFDFQCRVNHRFYGLSNFILGFYHQGIEIMEPDRLKVHLRDVVQRMNF